MRHTEIKNTYRFFVPPQSIGRISVSLSGQQAHQITNVLRLEPGSSIIVLDNSGWQYNVELTAVGTDAVEGAIRAKSLVNTEPRTKITLYQGVLRSNKFETILQKCTELGVAAFVPVISQRCVVSNIGEASSAKIERWQRIITEAAEQSSRGKLPSLRPAMLLQQACEDAKGSSFIAWESEQATSLRTFLLEHNLTRSRTDEEKRASRPFSVSVFIGPEGGFTPAEVQQAQAYGIAPVTLGPRILRAETAAVAASTIILYETGDMGV